MDQNIQDYGRRIADLEAFDLSISIATISFMLAFIVVCIALFFERRHEKKAPHNLVSYYLLRNIVDQLSNQRLRISNHEWKIAQLVGDRDNVNEERRKLLGEIPIMKSTYNDLACLYNDIACLYNDHMASTKDIHEEIDHMHRAEIGFLPLKIKTYT